MHRLKYHDEMEWWVVTHFNVGDLIIVIQPVYIYICFVIIYLVFVYIFSNNHGISICTTFVPVLE